MQDEYKDLTHEVAEMWETMRAENRMIEDCPGIKIGKPSPDAYTVLLPIETDGAFMMVPLSVEAAEALVYALLNVLDEAKEMTQEAEAEMTAHYAIEKARGDANGG